MGRYLRIGLLSSAFIVSMLAVTCYQSVLANPVGGEVVGGSAQISNPDPNTTHIHQATDRAIINWQTYNIAPGQTTQYFQPSSSSISLNRINGLNGGSTIMGNLNANGQVWLINPAGILFGRGAQVNTAGLFATTADIRNEDFMSGNYKFTSDPSFPYGEIVNEGSIKVQARGLVGLVGNSVSNRGMIRARSGTVLMGSARAFTLDFDGDQLINFVISQSGTPAPGRPAVSNTGRIDVSAGRGVVLGTGAARAIVGNAINMTGVTEATHVSTQGGAIILDAGGGSARVSGKIKASGGIVSVRANTLALKQAKISTSDRAYGGVISLLGNENLSIDQSLLKSNGLQSGGVIQALSKGNVAITGSTLQANGEFGGGQLFIGGNPYGQGPLPNAQNTIVTDSTLTANALMNGKGGDITVWSNGSTLVSANLSARGGALGGNGGWIETSGKNLNVDGIQIDTRAPFGETGTWLLDPTNIYIAINQANATAAGMSGTDSTAGYLVYDPSTGLYNNYAAIGAITDSLLTTATLTTGLSSSNIVVTTTNPSGIGAGNITIVDPISWSNTNTLTLTAANNISINNTITTGAAGSALILNAAGTVTQNSSGIIGGSGGLTQSGTGTVTLSQLNTYTGPTTVNSGTLSFNTIQNVSGGSSALGAPTTVGNGTISISGTGTLQYTGTGHSSNRVIFLSGSGATIDASGAGTLTLTGGVTDSGNNLVLTGTGTGTINSAITIAGGAVTKNGTGTWNLQGANTYSGATTVNMGTLTFSGSGTATSSSGFTVNQGAILAIDNTSTNVSNRLGGKNITLNAGEFKFTGSSSAAASESLGTLFLPVGYSTVTLNSGSGGATTLTFSDINRTATATVLFRGANLGGAPGATATNLKFTTSTGLNLTGDNAGQTTKTIVPYAIGDTSASGTGIGFVTYNMEPLTTTVNTNLGIRPLSIAAGEYTSTVATNANLRVTTPAGIAGGGTTVNSLFITGGGTSSLSGTLNIGSGAVYSNGGVGTNTLTGGTLAFGATEAKVFALTNLTRSNAMTGSGGFTLSGPGTFQQNTAVSAFGGFTVNSGILRAGTNNAFGNNTNDITLRSAGTFHIDTFTLPMNSITLTSGNTSGSSVIGSGELRINSGATVTVNTNGLGAVGASISASNIQLNSTTTFTIASGTASSGLSISSVMTSGGGIGLTKAGTGVLTLSGLNTFQGAVTINAGTLSINSIGIPNAASAVGTGQSTPAITIAGAGTLKYTGSGHTSTRAIILSGSGGTIDASGSGALTLSGGGDWCF